MPRTLYRHPISGHAHRVEVALSMFGLPATLVDVDLFARAQKAPEFLALNPFGQIPVLVDEDGTTVADSNAILVYLAHRHPSARAWLPQDAVGAAEVQRWFSFAAGPLFDTAGVARRRNVFGRGPAVDELVARAHDLLDVVDAHLGTRPWLAGDAPTLADISVYTYTAHAPEGGVDLGRHAAVSAWLARFEALPGYLPMKRSPVGLWAPAA